MNLSLIESVVRRLFSDAEFRARAIANPSEALSEYRLAASEQAALGKLCTQMAGGPEGIGTAVPTGLWW